MKKIISALLVAALACVMLFTVTACGGVTVTLSQTTAEIEVGKSVTLTATVSDGSEDITWSSSDDSIASVSSRGMVTGKKEGTVTITATSGEASASCTVTVKPGAPKKTVTISQATATVNRDASITLTAKASDNSAITWSSNDDGIATVDRNGKVTGVTEGTTVINAISGDVAATCTLTVTDTDKPEGAYNLTFSEESAMSKDKTWYYWNDQGWCGSNVTVTIAEYRSEDYMRVKYSGVTSAAWFGLQLFYKDTTISGYQQVDFDVVPDVSGKITVCGQVFEITEDKTKHITAYMNKTSDSAISIQMGVEATSEVISSGTMIFSNFAWTPFDPEYLTAPTLTIEDKTFTIDNTANAEKEEGVAGYELAFFGADAEIPAYKLSTSELTGEIDDSNIPNGTYTVKVRVLGQKQYGTSEWSSTGVSYEVSGNVTAYDLENKDEATATANPNKWYAYAEEGVTFEGSYENGTVTATFEGNEKNWWGTQLFYKHSGLETGENYTITMNIKSTVAGTITVCGQVVELAANETKALTIDLTQGTGATISVQMGIQSGEDSVIDIKAATVTISDITYAVATATDDAA